MSVYNSFTHVTWGDPMLAQIGGSDAHAYGDDPHAVAVANMTTGFEQAPQNLVDFITGGNGSTSWASNDPSSPGATPAPGTNTCGTLNPLDPNFWKCLDPGNKGWEHAKSQDPVYQAGANLVKDPKPLIQSAGIFLLAIVLVALGVHAILEA